MLKVYYLSISDYRNLAENVLYPWVSEDTRRMVQGFRNEQVRRTKLLGESMVRYLLNHLWGLQKDDYRLVKGEHGKPYIEANRQKGYFNLSHSGDYIVAAFSPVEVGVDIERKNKARLEVARRFFHPAEIALLESLTVEEQDDLFFRYWSVKESFLKYTGSGLSSPLSGFEVRFDDDRIYLFQEEIDSKVQIHECRIDRNYACFVCSETDERPEIHKFETAFQF